MISPLGRLRRPPDFDGVEDGVTDGVMDGVMDGVDEGSTITTEGLVWCMIVIACSTEPHAGQGLPS